MVIYRQLMRRIHAGVFVLVLVAAAFATIATQRPASAQVEQTVNVRVAKENAINDIYRDFLGRPAKAKDIDRFMDALGVQLSVHDVRVRVLASNAFRSEVGENSRQGFVAAAYQQVFGRAPTATELARDTGAIQPGENETFLGERRRFADALLRRADYDPDGLGVRELVLQFDDAGDIERFAFEIDGEFASDDRLSITVAHRKREASGTMFVRAGDQTVLFKPTEPLPLGGRVVGMVFLNTGNGARIADLRTPSEDLPPRTVDPVWPDRVFEDQRVIAYYGNHITSALGVLGETGPEAAVGRVNAAAAPFDAPDKRAVGAFEMIVTVAQRSAGADGDFSAPSNIEDVQRWVDVAEEAGLYVILDIQPGRSDFLTESQRYEEILKRPNVGLALDPEWRMGPGQIPGQVVGQVSAAEVNQVSAWLSDLVVENDLPEKIFMVHQFQVRMITNREDLIDRPGLATVIHADGFGGRAIKLVTYGLLQVESPFYNGFKLFIDEDTQIFQPADVLNFTTHPVPDFVSYQ